MDGAPRGDLNTDACGVLLPRSRRWLLMRMIVIMQQQQTNKQINQQTKGPASAAKQAHVCSCMSDMVVCR